MVKGTVGSHRIYQHPDDRRVVVPFHTGNRSLHRKTLETFLKATQWNVEAAMTEGEWIALFNLLEMEVGVINKGVVLRYQGRKIHELYWNRNRAGLIYFTVPRGEENSYPEEFWQRIDAHDMNLKRKDHPHLNAVPWPGMEERAFRNLLQHLAQGSSSG